MYTVEAIPAPELGNASFVVADTDRGVALVIDPLRDIERYLAVADDMHVGDRLRRMSAQFAWLNTAGVQLVPPVLLLGLLGLQINQLILPIIGTGILGLIVAIVACKLLGRLPVYRASDPNREAA